MNYFNWILGFSILALNWVDYHLTSIILKSGKAREGNPLMRRLMGRRGLLPAVKFGLATVVVSLLVYNGARNVLVFSLVFYTCLCLYQVFLIKKIRRLHGIKS